MTDAWTKSLRSSSPDKAAHEKGWKPIKTPSQYTSRKGGEPRLPVKIKPHEMAPSADETPHATGVDKPTGKEQVRVNHGYIDLTRDAQAFNPQRGQTYLWAHTHDNRLVVGVEDPSTAKKGVFAGATPGKGGDGLGHPSLGVSFDDKGVARAGRARMGGELNYSTVDKAWRMDNASGRYGRGRSTSDLRTAKDLLEMHMPSMPVTASLRPSAVAAGITSKRSKA